MFKHHRLLTATASVAASVTVALAGAAAASASPAASGTEHLQLMSTSATASTAPVIGYGVVTGGGVDHEGNKTDTVDFPGGSFKLTHSAGKGTQHFNPKTCLAQITEHGTYKISGGTGRYKGISGHGTYHFSILAIAKKVKGKCSQNAAPTSFEQVIRASGPLTQ